MYDLHKVVAIFPGAYTGQISLGTIKPGTVNWEDFEPEIVDKENGAAEPDMTALALPEDDDPYSRLHPRTFDGTAWVLLADVEGAILMNAKSISKAFTNSIAKAYHFHSMMAFAFSMSISEMDLGPRSETLCKDFHKCFRKRCNCRSLMTYIPEVVATSILDEYCGFVDQTEEPSTNQPEAHNTAYETVMQFDKASREKLAHLLPIQYPWL